MCPVLSPIKMQLLVVVAWVFIGISLTTAKTIEELAGEEDGESERIIGGSDAEAGQFPYAAALHYNGILRRGFTCTASILSNTTIMTAAHCVDMNGYVPPADRFYLIANVTRTSQSVRINVARVIVHPEWNRRTIENDIAILKTAEEIPFGDEVGPVCITRPDTPAMQYRNATAMGWGNISPIRVIQIIPETLQHVNQTIIPNLVCSALLGHVVNRNKICATGLFTGVCNGDSGGPLVHLSADNQPVEIGIASYINALFGCGKGSPAVFTRVSAYYDWIMRVARDTSICVV